MKKILMVSLLLAITVISFSQNENLPFTLKAGRDTSKPVIFYITGDGGWNKFSTAFMQSLNNQGYSIIGLDAKSYFWKKRDPKDAAKMIEKVIVQNLKAWKQHSIIILGYSFGADVAPFILNQFSHNLLQKTTNLILLSPSPKTDFEIHFTDMLGIGSRNGESVVNEINKTTQPVLIIAGDDEDSFPFNKLINKNNQVVKMPGGHHYDGNIPELCRQIISKIK